MASSHEIRCIRWQSRDRWEQDAPPALIGAGRQGEYFMLSLVKYDKLIMLISFIET